ncbi:Ribonuclease H domain [Macleaya cordata]|uniref:Ribonuclease H domain n=1 Tax=Macleaya cordata TaxID=56857 RepID=A0A200QQC2_MACCD|nr:Ribonuclease H domain [Macleaya cordata]
MKADYEKSIAFRYRDLCQLALNLSAKGALSMKAYQIARCTIETKLGELEKVSEEDIVISQLDVQGITSLHSPVEAVKNNEISKHLVSEDNQTISSASQIASCDPPRVRARGRPPKRVPPSLGENQRKKKARTEPESSEHNGVPSHSIREGIEPNDPCHFGGKDGQETQNNSRLSNLCPNICLYACAPPGPSGDLNDQYHSADASSFGEPFAGLSCIQTSEHNIFDLNQELTVGPSSIPNSQTSHFDLNQVNHVARPQLDVWLLPSSGWIKLNFGGCSKEICLGSDRRRIGGYGGTISLSDGSIIKAYAGSAVEVQAVEAEILGLWNGLKLLSALPSSPVWIEGDSQHVIKWLRKETDIPWRFTPMFFEMEAIMSRLVLGRINHIHKEGNSMADKLANEGLTKNSLVIWDQMPSL